MAQGGKRPGAGRKKGSLNKLTSSRAAFVQLLQDETRVQRLVEKLQVLADEGNVNAITYMLDQAFGRAKQHVEVEGNGRSYEDLIIGIGQALAGSKGKGSAGQAGG